jgi:hypothetical protein
MSLLRERTLASTVAAGLLTAWAVPAMAQQQTTPPNFSPDLTVGWVGVGEFLPVPGGVPPVTNNPKYPYVPNGQGRQPTFRIADLTNPNLKPWVKEVMKKDNDEVLAGNDLHGGRSGHLLPAMVGNATLSARGTAVRRGHLRRE